MRVSVVIYADTLVFINTFITYFLLICTAMLCGQEIRRVRILASSLIGGFYALTILLPHIPSPISLILRTAICALLCRIACVYRDIRGFLKTVGVFLLVNFLFAGGLFALHLLSGKQSVVYPGGVVYLNIRVPILLGGTVLCYAMIWTCLRLYGSFTPRTHIASLTLTQDGVSVRTQALFDTGHQLTDPFSGKPVLLVRSESAIRLVPDEVRAFLTDKTDAAIIKGEWQGKVRLFPVRSVGGSGLLPAFRCSEAQICCPKGELILHDIFIAVGDPAFAGSSYDALIPGELYDQIQEGVSVHAQAAKNQMHFTKHPRMSDGARHSLHTRSADAACSAAQKRRGGRSRAARRG